MDINKTREFYKNLKEEDLCNCAFCKNYIGQIKENYPQVSDYLDNLGVDIEKPFDTSPAEPEDEQIEYYMVQYIVMGDKEKFQKKEWGKVSIHIAEEGPSTGCKDQHFVIELTNIQLPWNNDKYEKTIDRIDKLLEKTCFLIDFLPIVVPKDSEGSYFDVEYYLLNSHKWKEIRDKFTNIIIKFMSYYPVKFVWNGIIESPSPQQVDKTISEIMENHSGTADFLFDNEKVLIVFEWDTLYLAIYNPNQVQKEILSKLAQAEGLFWRQAL